MKTLFAVILAFAIIVLLCSCATPKRDVICMHDSTDPAMISWGSTFEEARANMRKYSCMAMDNDPACNQRQCDVVDQ